MTVAKNIKEAMAGSSFIRKMFEEGARLKAKHGAKNVFDFTLGNPNLPPPEAFREALLDIIKNSKPGDNGYMPNIGYPDVRASVAEFISGEQEVKVTENEMIMTVGAGGALNAVFRAILDPGDEVITPTPCFVEYKFYTGNYGGILKTAPTHPDFTLNIETFADAINEKTKAVLINSPNNPTGQIYSKESLEKLGALLSDKEKEFNKTIYLISDEPYRKIVFDGVRVPSIFTCYNDSIVVTSYSKDLSIPGERIGFLAVNPNATHKAELFGGLALANRILGYVNAPALMQRAVGRLQGISVDVSEYKRKRDLLCDGLSDFGYEFITPPGTFYLFPKSPIKDDVKFVDELQKELILTVPGSGFLGPGYFRIAFCVDDDTIVNSLPGFERVIKAFK